MCIRDRDNTLNEYERYFQYKVSIRPEDLVVGKNYITDKQVSLVRTRDGNDQTVEWYQFKICLLYTSCRLDAGLCGGRSCRSRI